MTTAEECEASLAEQVRRHEVLKMILKAIAELAKTDPDGSEWIFEKLSEG